MDNKTTLDEWRKSLVEKMTGKGEHSYNEPDEGWFMLIAEADISRTF